MKLPEGWVETSVASVIIDLQPGFAQKPGEEDEGTIPQIRTHNINPEGKITLNGIKHVSPSEKELERYLLTKGDVIFNNTNSEEWVGKSAVFDRDGEFLFSNHITRLRPDSKLISPEYLASYLHLLSSMGYSKTRAKRWVSQAGIEGSALASFKIPLPTLPEQQRIVDMLQLADSFDSNRASTESTIQVLSREYYGNLFGDVYKNSKGWPLRKIGAVSDVVRGSSPRPQGDPRLFGGPIPRLMVSDLTRDGLWVDAKTDSLTVEGAKSSRPMPAQSVVVAVSGAPGLTAILNHDACIHDGFVGLRNLHTDLLAEFVAFSLNLLRAKYEQQAVGAVFRNLTTDQVKAITLPVPPSRLQEQFRAFLLQVRDLQRDIAQSSLAVEQLSHALKLDAFSGTLTTNWRHDNQTVIAPAEKARDELLRLRGFKSPIRPSEPEVPIAPTTGNQRPARHWLRTELSEFQRQVLAAFSSYTDQPLLAEDADVFNSFCDDESVKASLSPFDYSSNRIRRTLGQLAALGLIATLSLPKLNPATSERDYLKAFRPLRSDENTRLRDLEALRPLISANDAAPMYYFHVVLDRETSKRAGADDRFQVASLTDDDGADHSNLVDQGKHYAELAELADDIAARLAVRANQVVLGEA